MGFEVAPEPIGGGSSVALRILAVVLAASAVLGVALLTSRGLQTASDPAARASAIGAATAADASVAPTGAASLPTPVATGLSGPGTVVCNDAGADACGRIVSAALKQLRSGPRIEGIGVSTTLLCHEVLDCPPKRFVGFRPLGSAIVSYGPDQPAAWVNVVEPLPDPGRDPLAVGPVAWIIRWGP